MPEASPAANPAFTLVRRGYDPIQVNQYLSRPPAQQGPPPTFDILRRGYAPKEVDEYIRRLQTEGLGSAE
ncbi:MAG: hypothetical protein HOV87_21580 [Catenulispora sp.]|nr:hypothetical protein [Catenulispora sp.]